MKFGDGSNAIVRFRLMSRMTSIRGLPVRAIMNIAQAVVDLCIPA